MVSATIQMTSSECWLIGGRCDAELQKEANTIGCSHLFWWTLALPYSVTFPVLESTS